MRTEEIYHTFNELVRIDQQQEAFEYMKRNLEYEQYCAHFGCGKVLTMTEQLYGSLCHEHSVAPKKDITKHINY